MFIWTWLTQHPLATAWIKNALSFIAGVFMTWLFSRAARKKAKFDLAEAKQQQRDRAIGQLILAVSSSYKVSVRGTHLLYAE
jgi:threonine/homoserine/homoserine lactone efflux protein